MEIINIAGFVICAVILSVTIGRYTPWASVLIPLAVSAVAILYLLPQLKLITEHLRRLFDGVDSEYAKLLLRVVGISFIAQITAQICTDAGQKAMGDRIETAARILIAVYALPLIDDILKLITSFMGK